MKFAYESRIYVKEKIRKTRIYTENKIGQCLYKLLLGLSPTRKKENRRIHKNYARPSKGSTQATSPSPWAGLPTALSLLFK